MYDVTKLPGYDPSKDPETIEKATKGFEMDDHPTSSPIFGRGLFHSHF